MPLIQKEFVLKICIIAISVRTTLLTSKINGTLFSYFFIIHPIIFFLNHIDVEFDFSIGHALVLFCFYE